MKTRKPAETRTRPLKGKRPVSPASIETRGKRIPGNPLNRSRRESDNLLNNLIDQSPVPMWISDGGGTLMRINRACLDLMRIREEEVLGKYNVLRDDIVERQGLMPLVERVFRNAETVHFEITYDTSSLEQLKLGDSASVRLATTIFPIRDKNGRLAHAVIQHEDVTERKRAEEALRRSNELYRAITENVRDVIWILRLSDMRFTYLSPSIRNLRGYTPEEVRNQSPDEVLTPESFERFNRELSLLLNSWSTGGGREPLSIFEVDQPHRDGSIVNTEVTVTPLRDDGNRIVEILGVSRDVTDRKRAKEALRIQFEESEKNRQRAEFLAELVERSSQPLGVGYPDGRFGVVNSAFCELLGVSREELLETDWSEGVTPKEWRDIERAKLEELHRTGRSIRYEKEYLRRDGVRVPVELLVHLVRREDGSPDFYYSFVTDLTERKRAADALLRRTKELEASAEELGRFNRAMVGRECRMIELKAEINALCAELGRPARYEAGAASGRTEEPGIRDPRGTDGA
jgi:PAS domain S-box-containing protein